ncbi:unnamed protein product [Arabidopsis arenosa]|uniref:F-box domain-containing protein n=2 Tax=Arabidopsis arenosa TaxID=38785 RepID=A0A8S2B4P3_ARAAE|nr:unnamed protein product [Arabidopsis arenosa]
MRNRRRTYNVRATPPSLFPESLTVNSIVQARGDWRSKRKCYTGSWDQNIPTDLLQDILSRLGLKANIKASIVCKTWLEEAVSVRKLQPRPWLFYRQRRAEHEYSPAGTYILFDPLRSQQYKLNFPELERNHGIICSRDGWLLTYDSGYALFLNPFTQESFYLTEGSPYKRSYSLAFSAAPTSASCMVISYPQISSCASVVIDTWRPGETVWTTHWFKNQLPKRIWGKCVFSNGMFYCLSTCGYLGVFDPSKSTWNILPVKPCPAFRGRIPVLMTEHEGDIFVIVYTCKNNNPMVLKLNFKRNVWEEKKDLGGLTVFASFPSSFARAGLSTEQRNKICLSYRDKCGRYDVSYSVR